MTEFKASYLVRESSLHYAIGVAISNFSLVEVHLLRTHAAASGQSIADAAALFSLFKNFTLALQVADLSIKRHLSDERNVDWWVSLVEYLRELSGDRNFEAFLSEMNNKHIREESEVIEIALDFKYASELLSDFCANLKSQTTSQSRFFGPIARRRPSRKQRLAEKPQSPKRPPRSSR
jgi:hypothetical protein